MAGAVTAASLAAAQWAAATLGAVTARATARATDLHAQVDPARAVEPQWAALAPEAAALLADAQARAALVALAYLDEHAAACGAGGTPGPYLSPAAVSGRTSAGHDLAAVLARLVGVWRGRLAAGQPPGEAWHATAPRLARLVRSEVADAHREYLSGSLCLDDRVIAYQRLVTLPACARCLILAGQRYTFSAGFKRHPGCTGCTHIPIYHLPGRGEVGGTPDDHTPRALFGEMSPAQQLAAVGGKSEAVQSIHDGVDMFAVVNGQNHRRVTIRRTEARIARSLGFQDPADLIVHHAGRPKRSLAYLRARYGDDPRQLRTALARNGWLTEALHLTPPGGTI
ncbi:hypothetical protein AGRA3207_000178 [Actinomadura graeca]|uniref:Uncharacterized protein n=1 Tax=Actinomadura graeca TaxID=2750812 RepID=A0ABX8QMM5_9ACTN|nr:hypothetical protein [Actinomadura graeca]QXJ19616.1 hypothetical protein AGRA3207_000178 [Actinomadura graeca]